MIKIIKALTRKVISSFNIYSYNVILVSTETYNKFKEYSEKEANDSFESLKSQFPVQTKVKYQSYLIIY